MSTSTVLGLMSGTSADGVDAVLARFSGRAESPRWQILSSHCQPYDAALRQRLLNLGQGVPMAAAEILELAEDVTEAQAAAARSCDPEARADLVGCHGQTVWHRPPEPGRRGASWQLLQGPLLASLLECPVVFDFRAADLALGGEGAPLVPAADAALLGGIGGWRALLNLGGIANLTLLPPEEGPDRQAPILGWDCGPANTLIDLAVERFSDGNLDFDAGGDWARSGTVDEALLTSWLAEPYFQRQPPKSTGRELFGGDDLSRRLLSIRTSRSGEARRNDSPARDHADALATLTAFTAAVVSAELDRFPRPLEMLVAGGGARNGFLMEQLRRRCRGTEVSTLAEWGIEEHQREALAFALLAWWHGRNHPGSLPSVTGARRAAVLGVCARP